MKLPGFQLCEPWIATGITGTSSCSATIAAPGWSSPGTPLRWRVPSAKRPSAPPSRTIARIVRTASRSDSPRRTGNVPKARMNVPSPGTRCASILAMKLIVRGQAQPSAGGSSHEKWLQAITSPPVIGTRSLP